MAKGSNKVRVPSAAAILKMSPEQAYAVYSSLPKNAKLNPAQLQAFQTKAKEQNAKPKSYQVPYLTTEGAGSLGGVVRDQTTNAAQGYMPGTHTFKGRAPGQDPTAVALADSMGYAASNPQLHTARYLAGDQFKPVDMAVDDMITLQENLEKAGLLEPGSYVRGHWGGTSAAAYAAALADANVADQDVETVIQQRIANPQQKKDERGPLVTTLTNPADIMQAAKTAARSLYGRNIELPQGVQDMLVSGLQETERQIQAQEYSLGGVNGPGGVMTREPTPDAYAEQQLKQLYPGRETDDEFASAMNTILNMMGGGQ